MTQTEIFQHSAAILDRLKLRGLELYEPRGFEEVPSLVVETGRKMQHPMMALSRNDFTIGQAFWLFLKNEGRCVAGISAKLTDLKGEAFSSYVRRTSNNQYDSDGEVIAEVAMPIDAELRGRLIYFGEFEIAEGFRGSRAIMADFTQYAKMLAASYWDFDWMYTIIAYKHRRLADDYGFHWRIRNAITWNEPVPAGRSNDHMILATNSAHFLHVLRTVKPGEL